MLKLKCFFDYNQFLYFYHFAFHTVISMTLTFICKNNQEVFFSRKLSLFGSPNLCMGVLHKVMEREKYFDPHVLNKPRWGNAINEVVNKSKGIIVGVRCCDHFFVSCCQANSCSHLAASGTFNWSGGSSSSDRL